MKTNFFGKQFISINDKLIVCSEKGRKYIAINKGEKDIIKIHVDNELITSGERCDYALNICNEKKVYLIELKGTEKDHAYAQIIATYEKFKDKCKEYEFYSRIVISKDSYPRIKGTNEKRFLQMQKRGMFKSVIVKCNVLEEVI